MSTVNEVTYHVGVRAVRPVEQKQVIHAMVL